MDTNVNSECIFTILPYFVTKKATVSFSICFFTSEHCSPGTCSSASQLEFKRKICTFHLLIQPAKHPTFLYRFSYVHHVKFRDFVNHSKTIVLIYLRLSLKYRNFVNHRNCQSNRASVGLAMIIYGLGFNFFCADIDKSWPKFIMQKIKKKLSKISLPDLQIIFSKLGLSFLQHIFFCFQVFNVFCILLFSHTLENQYVIRAVYTLS